jgi:tRNA pseudouridine65 synthase
MNVEMIQLLEENSDFIVLHKPHGLSVHNQSPSVLEQLQGLKKPIHFVNRLDQETSGLMIVAQKPETHQKLVSSLENGHKFYRALLRSPWKNPAMKTTWSWPISDKAEGRKNPQGASADRKDARTDVTVLRTNKYFTEIQAEILTGRQHQIRKHALLANHPIVGDKRYNEEKYNKNIEKFYGAPLRMHLHAERLNFEFGGKTYEFSSAISFENFFKE